MTKRTSKTRFSFNMRERGGLPVRIYRANDWDKAVMGAIHQRIRSNPEKGKQLLDMLWNEFGTIMIIQDKDEKDKVFLEYTYLLSQKPFGELGVKVKSKPILEF